MMLQVRNREGDLLILERDPLRGTQLKWPVGNEESAFKQLMLADGQPAYLLNGDWRVRWDGDEVLFRGWWTWGVVRLVFVRNGWVYQIRSYSRPERVEERRSDVVVIADSWLASLAQEDDLLHEGYHQFDDSAVRKVIAHVIANFPIIGGACAAGAEIDGFIKRLFVPWRS
jgi:hypothetical protein